MYWNFDSLISVIGHMVIVIITAPKVHIVGNASRAARISKSRTKEQIQYHFTYLNSTLGKLTLLFIKCTHNEKNKKGQWSPKSPNRGHSEQEVTGSSIKADPQSVGNRQFFLSPSIILCLIIVYEGPPWSCFFAWKVTNTFILETVWAICHAA